MSDPIEHERLLTPREAAAMFRVKTQTIARWADSGKLTIIRTPTGYRRYRESEIRALLEESTAR
jgi:excisionase family DNA binding protein